MPLKVLNLGERLALEYLVNKGTPQDLVLRLFKNDLALADTNTLASFTEADFSGYAPVTLTGANWTVTEGDPAVAQYAEEDFTSNADQTAQTVYGYYLTRAVGGEPVWAERFPHSQVIATNGSRVAVTPRIELRDDTD